MRKQSLLTGKQVVGPHATSQRRIPPRYESKYVIPVSLMKPIRDYIRPFCNPDENARGTPPEYTNVTLQLDSPTLALHKAKEYDSLHRFKLRIRSYVCEGNAPLSLEIKRKLGTYIVKTSAKIALANWTNTVCTRVDRGLRFKRPEEQKNYLEFVRLVNETDATPVALVRYVREAYHSKWDSYARITFDRKLQYAPMRSWDPRGDNCRWRAMDSSITTGGSYSGVVLEIKTTDEVPVWAVEMVKRFNLVRRAFCKYSTAIRLESQFHCPGELDFAPQLY